MGHECIICQKDAKKFCGKCKQEWYCSRECQVTAWRTHKGECDKMAEKARRPNLPKSSQFEGLKLVGFGQEDKVAVWAALSSGNLEENGGKHALGLKFMIVNENEGNARIVSKTLLLTVKGQTLRRKVLNGSERDAKFVDGTNKGENYSSDKLDLEKGQFGVTRAHYEFEQSNLEETLTSIDFVEVPVKIDGKGVVNIKVKFEKQPQAQQSQQPVVDSSLNPKAVD